MCQTDEEHVKSAKSELYGGWQGKILSASQASLAKDLNQKADIKHCLPGECSGFRAWLTKVSGWHRNKWHGPLHRMKTKVRLPASTTAHTSGASSHRAIPPAVWAQRDPA